MEPNIKSKKFLWTSLVGDNTAELTVTANTLDDGDGDPMNFLQVTSKPLLKPKEKLSDMQSLATLELDQVTHDPLYMIYDNTIKDFENKFLNKKKTYKNGLITNLPPVPGGKRKSTKKSRRRKSCRRGWFF